MNSRRNLFEYNLEKFKEQFLSKIRGNIKKSGLSVLEK